MRLSKPTTTKLAAPVGARKVPVDDAIKMKGAGKSYGKATLPTKLDPPVDSLSKCILVIHGEKKIGKTSLTHRFPKSFFFFFEPGGKGFSKNGKLILEWEEFQDFITLLEKEREYAETLIVDTIDKCYEMCFKHICDKEKMKHPTDMGYGKGWQLIKDEFTLQMDRLLKLGRGVIFLSHTENKSFLSLHGGETNKLVSTMAKAARDYITGIADIIGYYGYYGSERFLTLEGSELVDAGSRLENNFLTTSGERIHSIPMGKNPDQSYANLIAAFNNQQKDRCEPEEATGIETRAPISTKRR